MDVLCSVYCTSMCPGGRIFSCCYSVGECEELFCLISVLVLTNICAHQGAMPHTLRKAAVLCKMHTTQRHCGTLSSGSGWIKSDNDIHQRLINKKLIMRSLVNGCPDDPCATMFGIIDLKCD